MPSEKRARQRALREQKVAVQESRARRSRLGRRVLAALGGVGIVVLLIVVLSNGSSKTKSATSASTTTTVVQAVAPTCPPTSAAGAPKRVIAFTKAPPTCDAPNAVFNATVRTDVGTFLIRLREASSPAAVNNFVFLARYRDCDGITFHRVIPGFVVQGGDPTGDGTGGPGYHFTGDSPPASCAAKKDCYPLGGVAMANTSSSPSTDGS